MGDKAAKINKKWGAMRNFYSNQIWLFRGWSLFMLVLCFYDTLPFFEFNNDIIHNILVTHEV